VFEFLSSQCSQNPIPTQRQQSATASTKLFRYIGHTDADADYFVLFVYDYGNKVVVKQREVHLAISKNLTEEAGCFRSVEVAVIDSSGKTIHKGLPSEEVHESVAKLLQWGESADIHPIILSAAIHFMIEHIHPFRDGNGRIGRLWQTLILSKWQPLFYTFPIETMIRRYQKGYYQAIADSQIIPIDCRPFIEYTLNIIEQSLQDILKNGGLNGGLNLLQQEIISLIRDNPYIKTFDIAQKLKRPVRTIENNLRILREKAIIGLQGSKKSGRWIVS
jgi:putative fic family protein